MSETTTYVELTAAEWRLVEAALRAFLTDFGHDEADIIEQIRTILTKLSLRDVEEPVR